MLATRNLSIQIFNLSIQVSLSLKQIVQVTLMLIYGTFFNSVLSTYVASQPTLVANKETSKSLFTTVANPIPRKCLTFASRCLKSSLTQWIKCTYRNLRSNLSLLQKISWCPWGGHKQHLYQQHDFPFNVYKSVEKTNANKQGLLLDQDRGKPWIQLFW